MQNDFFDWYASIEDCFEVDDFNAIAEEEDDDAEDEDDDDESNPAPCLFTEYLNFTKPVTEPPHSVNYMEKK